MNKTLFGVSILALGLISFGLMTEQAFAQYMGNIEERGKTGQNTLEETLELAKRKIEAAEENPSTGSGTPYLDAGGVLGASAIAGAIFGGVAAAFFLKGRTGRYAAQGRG